MSTPRRTFLQQLAVAGAPAPPCCPQVAWSASSYKRIIGANDRVRVGVVGFSDRHRNSHLPPFMKYHKQMNFDVVGVSDLWTKRREEGVGVWTEKMGHKVAGYRQQRRAVRQQERGRRVHQHRRLPSTPCHTIEAVQAGCDAYVEKPFAETMADNRAALKAVRDSKRIVQIGSQRRSGDNYKAAEEFIRSGKFGPITMVELTWNVNQPGRWRRPELVAQLREQDIDWKRYQMNRPPEAYDPRKYLEYRLFWPYSSGLPGQWMSHQIDTVHWFTGLKHPRSVVANGGIYMWKDGRRNWDTITSVFDYGPEKDITQGFQVMFASRMHNGDEHPAEIYYSNGGELNLNTNMVSPTGGLTQRHADAMHLKAKPVARVQPLESQRGRGLGQHRRRHAHRQPRAQTGWSACAAARSPTPPSRLATATPSPTS